VIDLHCHVLPGLDDGPATLEDSLALAEAAEASGVATLVATPHVSWRYPNRAASMHEGVRALRAAIRDEGIGVDVRPGAEIAISRIGELSDDELSGLRLGDGPWLMIECPLSPTAGDFEPVLNAVHRRGYWIILAHPERCPHFHRDPSRLRRLVSDGMLCSVTASSLTGAFGREARDFASALVRERLVHNVTSDAHDAVHRPPAMRDEITAAAPALPELLRAAEWLTQEIPQAILDGDPLPRPPSASDAARPQPSG
jgi:protein-tyrosine phosphatase